MKANSHTVLQVAGGLAGALLYMCLHWGSWLASQELNSWVWLAQVARSHFPVLS